MTATSEPDAGPMFPCGQVLVGVTEGRDSDEAVRAGAALAKRFDAALELLHGMPEPTGFATFFDPLQIETVGEERAHNRAEVLRAHLSHRHAGLEFAGRPIEDRLEVVRGSPARALLERARSAGNGLVLLGDGRKRKHLDVGGVARAVFAKSKSPVWQQPGMWKGVRSILAPIDLSEHSLMALGRTVELAQLFEAKVTVLYAHDVRELAHVGVPDAAIFQSPYDLPQIRESAHRHFEQALEAFDWKGVRHTALFEDDEPARAILSRQDSFDLIALGTHGRTGLTATLLGSVAWSVMRLASTATLAIPAPNRAWLI